jgi:MFS family permease
MGRKEEALEILAALRGDGDPEHTDVQKEYNDIMEAIEIEHEGEMGYLDMFKKDPLNIARRVHLSVWLQIIQELTGIGVVTVYAPECFQKAGFSSQKSQLIAGINNITYMLSTLVAVFTLDRFGRRFSLFWGAAAQGISLILLSIMVHPSMLAKNATAYGIAGTVFIFMYTAFFGMTWLTVPWLYPVEIYPLKVRAKGGAWSVVGWSVGNALVAEITPPLLAAWNNYTFLFFGLINIIAIPIVWALYPGMHLIHFRFKICDMSLTELHFLQKLPIALLKKWILSLLQTHLSCGRLKRNSEKTEALFSTKPRTLKVKFSRSAIAASVSNLRRISILKSKMTMDGPPTTKNMRRVLLRYYVKVLVNFRTPPTVHLSTLLI